jgi:hypothetical protein
MQSPLHRLYKTKFVLASFVGVVVGYLLMAVGNHIDAAAGASLLKVVDLHDIGIVLMTSGLVVVLFTYLGNEEAEQDADARTSRAVNAAAPAFVASVIDAIAHTPEEILAVTAPEVLDHVIENSLAARFHDRELAADTYTDLYEQVVRTDERWHDVHVDVVLTPWEQGPASGEGSLFVATVTWEFRTTPANPIMRFACVSDLDEYRSLSRDPTATETWYFKPIGKLDGASPEVFDLLQFAVDGKTRRIRRTTRRGAQLFAVELGDAAQQEVSIAYTYRSLVQRNGHLLHVDPARLSKDFTVRFSYAGCGIRFVNVMDNITGPRYSRIAELPASDPTPSVEVSYDGWVFPKGGVAFIWVLDDEMTPTHSRTPSSAERKS